MPDTTAPVSVSVRDTDDLRAIRERLLAADRIVMSTHLRPDGDALGSEIATALFLKQLGKEVTILNTDPEGRQLEWLLDEIPKGFVTVYESGALAHAEAIAGADVLLVLDTNAKHRLGNVGEPFITAGKPILLLDHHPDPEDFFDLTCVRTDAAATAEIIYDLIAGHDPEMIDRAIATALYVGLVTDTGSFRYSATTPRTHAIVADLLARGEIQPEPIHISLFDNRSFEGLRLLARALGTMQRHYGGRLATLHVTQDMLHDTGATFDSTEGLVNYGLSLEGTVAAVIFLETPSAVKMSFRSKGDCPINAWASKFGGGGHPNAAGAYVPDRPLRGVMKEVIDAAPAHVAVREAADDHEGDLSEEDRDLLASFQGRL